MEQQCILLLQILQLECGRENRPQPETVRESYGEAPAARDQDPRSYKPAVLRGAAVISRNGSNIRAR